jgi:hypothetical protein
MLPGFLMSLAFAYSLDKHTGGEDGARMYWPGSCMAMVRTLSAAL